MSLTRLVWVGIIVDLILVSHAKPARVNVDLDVNIKSPKANQEPLDVPSNRGIIDWLSKKTCKLNPFKDCVSGGGSSSSEEQVIMMTGLA